MSEFDARAAEWDTPERQERAHALADAIRAHVPLERAWRAVDIGAGTGLLGLDLLDDIDSVVLTDPSAGMVEVARAKIASLGTERATAVVFDVPAAEPPAEAPFDLAVSLMALHHVEDTAASLRSLHDMLRPGGYLALIDLDEEDGSFHAADQPGIHHRGFDRQALEALAAHAGFDEARTRIVHRLERDGHDYPLFLLTARRRG